MKTTMLLIKPIKRKCGSLWTSERSTQLPPFFHSMPDPSSRLLAFKGDITKLEAGFCIGDHDGDRLVFILSTNSKGDI